LARFDELARRHAVLANAVSVGQKYLMEETF